MATPVDPAAAAAATAAAERKRKRLEAWRKRQQAATTLGAAAAAPVPTVSAAPSAPAPPPPPPPPPVVEKKKVTLSLGVGLLGKRKKKKKKQINEEEKKSESNIVTDPIQEFGDDDDEERERKRSRRAKRFDLDDKEEGVDNSPDSVAPPIPAAPTTSPTTNAEAPPRRRWGKKSSRWDSAPEGVVVTAAPQVETEAVSMLPPSSSIASETADTTDDALDKFMDQLQTGTEGTSTSVGVGALSIDVGGSMVRLHRAQQQQQQEAQEEKSMLSPVSGGVITAEDLAKLQGGGASKRKKKQDVTAADIDKGAAFTHSDWESDAQAGGGTSASEAETDDEEEEKARLAFIEALKQSAPLPGSTVEEEDNRPPQLAAEVKSEKQRREETLHELEREAEQAQKLADSSTDTGRLYNDAEGGVMEEAVRNLGVLTAAPDALEVLAELNKKKELKAVDHSSIEYIDVRKNLYVIPRSLASLSDDDVVARRVKLKVKVRGRGAPAPVSSFRECGLSERILAILAKQGIDEPFPVQAQCLPCIMAGRDVIGIAKTGSGKTLAYLLPMLRHIGDQPPLGPSESGPIGLILAPARELAVQIHSVCKVFARRLNMNTSFWRSIMRHDGSTAVYGGAGVADQIADLKRGTHIAVATPGRLIDILTMQSGKILSLQRVSYVVMDEADRMFDMGFAPQISAIVSAVRPDRQTVLFSATFPKAVEALARKSLQYPIEVMVGGRSVASDSVSQHAEVIEEEDKFLRLLQLLGEHADEEKKVIVFVDTQVRADSVFEQLIRCGYPSLSLHGGKEQEDRDSTLADFKRKDGPGVLVATSVAGRGLDVASCGCVVNYSPPNHLEDYVHRVGRTGRAGRAGVSYTFVNSSDEAKFAPIVVRAMIEAGQIPPDDLKELSDSFKEKVKKGEARYAGSGFKGKGYSYDSSELNDAQKLIRLEKRQALIEAGLMDPDEEDPALGDLAGSASKDENTNDGTAAQNATEKKLEPAIANLSADVLALPGMKDAIMRKAGITTDQDGISESASGRPVSTGANHFVEELEINDYPREARWKVTQKETTSRLQDEFQTAVTLKGEYLAPNRTLAEGERKLYLHLEATSEQVLKNCIHEIRRLLNEETLRVGARGMGGSHKYSVL